MDRKPVIQFENFSFKYKIQSSPTLLDIDLTIYEGERVLILGPSGCGKSTLVNCINGLIPFSREGIITGCCRVNGRDTRTLSVFELSKEVGTVMQDTDAQFVGLSVGEDIAFSMENEAVPRGEMLPRVYEAAGIVSMQEFLAALPFDLSGGQKQKVALAGVIQEAVKILLFDEPLASLDPRTGVTAMELIDQIAVEHNKATIIIEHRLEDVLHRPVDRILLMSGGRIIADMSPNELLCSPLLKANGIREPLYITAMKYAGCTLEDNDMLCDIGRMELTETDRQKLLAFHGRPAPKAERAYGDECVRAENVCFAYTDKDVVRNLSFGVREGERVAIIGKNGAGKSTLAQLVCGVLRPRTGAIYIGGEDYSRMTIKEIGENVGYVMQNPNQMIIKDIIADEVDLALKIRGMPADERQGRVHRALEVCGLYTMRNWPVDSVSYGQKKRVTIAAIMALEPTTLILDEPTTGQDYRHYTEIINFINELNEQYHKTLLFVTHDMHLAIENTERAIVFADGEIIADSSVYSVLSDDAVIEQANLKQTSLYLLAKKLGLPPEEFIEHFIHYERMVRRGE